jgi:hemoglobin/transferrin/lactoferrin receptor protein
MIKHISLLILLVCSTFSFFVSAQAPYVLKDIIHNQAEDGVGVFSRDDGELLQTDTIGTQDLNTSNHASLDDVLRLAAGATTSRGPRSSGEAPQVRGLDASKIFIKIDGVRQNFQTGHSSMLAVDFENLKAVHILKSAGNVSEGGSLGGGIKFVSKRPVDILRKNKKNGSEFKYQNNSANNESVYNAKTVFKNRVSSGLISLSRKEAGDQDLSDGTTLNHSGYKDVSALGKFYYKKFEFSYEYFLRTDDSPLDPSLNPPDSLGDLHANSKIQKDNFRIQYKSENNLNILTYFNKHQTLKAKKDKYAAKEERSQITIGLNVDKVIKKSSFGGEYYHDDLTSSFESNDPESTIDKISGFPKAKSGSAALYFANTIQLGAVDVTPSVRLSHYQIRASQEELASRSASYLAKNLHLKYQLSPKLETSIGYSEGFNAPKLTQVYPNGMHAKGDEFIVADNHFIPNQNLEHELSKNIEVGFKYAQQVFSRDDLFEFSVTHYQKDIQNYIAMDRIDRAYEAGSGIKGTTQFINIERVEIQGDEVELAYAFDIFDFTINYSKIRGKNKTLNIFLEDFPADSYNFDLRAYLDRYDMTIGYLGLQAMAQNRVNAGTIQRTDETKGYFIHNAFINKRFLNDFEVNFRVDNLSNTKYRRHSSHLYESEQDVKIAFKYKINTL